MAYSERELAVLRKYKIVDDKGDFRNVTLYREGPGRSTGPGPLIEPDAVNRLIAADTTPDKKWLDWIFYEAAGGAKAKLKFPEVMESIRKKYLEDRTKPKLKNGKIIRAAMTPEEAEKKWLTQEEMYLKCVEVADQDIVHYYGTFGYYRSWPGKDRIYEHVVAAISKYLPIYDKALEMNAEIGRGKGKVTTEPSNIGSYEDMNKVTDTVKRYFAARVARTDVRIGTDRPIYEDDNLVVIAPLTHAASVRYGFPKWKWSDPDRFNAILRDPAEQVLNKWTNLTSYGVVFFLRFKVPVPGWILRERKPETWEPAHATRGAHKLYDLTDLTLHVTGSDMQGDPNDWTIYDQDSRSTLNVRDVKRMITGEVERLTSQSAEYLEKSTDANPIDIGQPVYATPEEAQSVIRSVDNALASVKDYMQMENRPKVVTDPTLGE